MSTINITVSDVPVIISVGALELSMLSDTLNNVRSIRSITTITDVITANDYYVVVTDMGIGSPVTVIMPEPVLGKELFIKNLGTRVVQSQIPFPPFTTQSLSFSQTLTHLIGNGTDWEVFIVYPL